MRKIGTYEYKNYTTTPLDILLTYGEIQSIEQKPGDKNPNKMVYHYTIKEQNGNVVVAKSMAKKAYPVGTMTIIALNQSPTWGLMVCEPWQAISNQANLAD